MAMSIPPHYSHTNVATVDGTGTGRLHVDTEFTSVTSAAQSRQIRLPTGYSGLRIEGYVGANGFTLVGADSINGGASYQVPPNYYFSVTKLAAGLWIVSLVDNLGQGGGVPAGYSLWKSNTQTWRFGTQRAISPART